MTSKSPWLFKTLLSPDALLCKKREFITLGHNELRGNIGEILPLTREGKSIGGNVSVEARADVSARGF